MQFEWIEKYIFSDYYRHSYTQFTHQLEVQVARCYPQGACVIDSRYNIQH